MRGGGGAPGGGGVGSIGTRRWVVQAAPSHHRSAPGRLPVGSGYHPAGVLVIAVPLPRLLRGITVAIRLTFTSRVGGPTSALSNLSSWRAAHDRFDRQPPRARPRGVVGVSSTTSATTLPALIERPVVCSKCVSECPGLDGPSGQTDALAEHAMNTGLGNEGSLTANSGQPAGGPRALLTCRNAGLRTARCGLRG